MEDYKKGMAAFASGESIDITMASIEKAYQNLKQSIEAVCQNTTHPLHHNPLKHEHYHTYINCGIFYTQLLDLMQQYDGEAVVFNDMMAYDSNGFFLGEYAIFLHRRKKDPKKAEKFYEKALHLFPMQCSIHLKYAGFLRYVKKDLIKAHQHYEKAIEQQANAETFGAYASFLHATNKIDEAENMYKKAIDDDSSHVNNLCNYGLLLSEQRKNYAKAELYYKDALRMSDEKHANTLYNFAVMLDTHCKRKAEAEKYYRQTIELQPNHAYSLYNLAVLLEDKLMQLTKMEPPEQQKEISSARQEDNNNNEATTTTTISSARSTTSATTAAATGLTSPKTSPRLIASVKEEILLLYSKAQAADSNDATITADFGRFLLLHTNEIEEAETLLCHALALDGQSEIALYHLGSLLLQKKNEWSEAEKCFRKLLQRNEKHCLASLQLARVLTATLSDNNNNDNNNNDSSEKVDSIFRCYRQAIPLLKQPWNALQEYMSVVDKYGNTEQQQQALDFKKSLNHYN